MLCLLIATESEDRLLECLYSIHDSAVCSEPLEPVHDHDACAAAGAQELPRVTSSKLLTYRAGRVTVQSALATCVSYTASTPKGQWGNGTAYNARSPFCLSVFLFSPPPTIMIHQPSDIHGFHPMLHPICHFMHVHLSSCHVVSSISVIIDIH